MSDWKTVRDALDWLAVIGQGQFRHTEREFADAALAALSRLEASPCPPCQKCDSLRELLKEAVEVMRPFAEAAPGWGPSFQRAAELVARIEKGQGNSEGRL